MNDNDSHYSNGFENRNSWSRGRTVRIWAGIVALAMLVASCGSEASVSSDDAGNGDILIVVTTSMLGDIVSNIVGNNATVETLLPRGADPHEYQLSSRQIARIADADLVIVNGLNLEEAMNDVLVSATTNLRTIRIADLVDPIPYTGANHDDHDDHGTDHDEHDEHGTEHGDHHHAAGYDPHVWMDPIRMSEAVSIIAGELAQIAPEIDWNTPADEYSLELISTHGVIEEILADIPESGRKLITNHASLGYFAQRYDFEVIATVIPAGSTLANPSSADLAALVATLRVVSATTIFAETIDTTTLADAVAKELGGTVAVVELFTGSLGDPGSGAETLIEMLTTNAERIAAALS